MNFFKLLQNSVLLIVYLDVIHPVCVLCMYTLQPEDGLVNIRTYSCLFCLTDKGVYCVRQMPVASYSYFSNFPASQSQIGHAVYHICL